MFLHNLIINTLGIANVRRKVWVASELFYASKFLKLALHRFAGVIFCRIKRQMLVPDSLPNRISNQSDCIGHL